MATPSKNEILDLSGLTIKADDLILSGDNPVPFEDTGLSAPRSIRGKDSDRWSIRDFGNENAGLSDNLAATDEAESFRKALASGERIYVPPGRYPLRSFDPTSSGFGSGECSVYVRKSPIDLEFASNAIVIPGTEIDGNKGVFRFEGGDDLDPNDAFSILNITGMTVDTSELDPLSTGSRILDVFYYNRAILDKITMGSSTADPSGSDIGFAGADTGVGIHACNHVTVRNPWMVGFGDAAFYVNGEAGVNRGLTDNRAEGIEFIGGFYWRNLNCITTKRDHMVSSIIGGVFRENVSALNAGTTDDGPDDSGRAWHIIGPRIYKTQGRPIVLRGGHGHVISGAHICDFGLLISDQSAISAVTIGGVNLWGTKASVVSGGYIGFREWALPGGAATSNGPHGVVLTSNIEADPVETGDNNLVTGVVFEKVYHSIRESANCDYNKATAYTEIDVVAGSLESGVNSSFVPFT